MCVSVCVSVCLRVCKANGCAGISPLLYSLLSFPAPTLLLSSLPPLLLSLLVCTSPSPLSLLQSSVPLLLLFLSPSQSPVCLHFSPALSLFLSVCVSPSFCRHGFFPPMTRNCNRHYVRLCLSSVSICLFLLSTHKYTRSCAHTHISNALF